MFDVLRLALPLCRKEGLACPSVPRLLEEQYQGSSPFLLGGTRGREDSCVSGIEVCRKHLSVRRAGFQRGGASHIYRAPFSAFSRTLCRGLHPGASALAVTAAPHSSPSLPLPPLTPPSVSSQQLSIPAWHVTCLLICCHPSPELRSLETVPFTVTSSKLHNVLRAGKDSVNMCRVNERRHSVF